MTTADSILEAAGVSGHEEESDDSCWSEKCHPKRSGKGGVNLSYKDNQTSVNNQYRKTVMVPGLRQLFALK